MSLPLESVREELLRAGVTPRYAQRYVMELRDHLADLIERERRSGRDAAAAFERAQALLGAESLLARAVIESAPRALAVRAPWAVFAILPVFAFIGLFAALVYSMWRILGPIHAAWPGGIPNSYTGLIAAASIIANYLLGPACIAGIIAIALRQRLVSGWVWVGLALTALCSGALGFHMNMLPATAGTPGGAVFSAVPAVYVDGHLDNLATLAMVLGRAGSLFSVAGVAYVLMRKASRAASAPESG